MNKEEIEFIEGYEDLLDKGYCDCNEMNCLGYNSPKEILRIVKKLQQENKQLEEQKKLNEEHQRINGELREENQSLRNQLDFIEEQNKYISKLENNYKKAIHILTRFNEPPCELIDESLDNKYCEEKCGNGYKKCWEHYIEKCYSLEPFELESSDSNE